MPVHAPDVVRAEPGQRVRRRVEPAACRRVVHEEPADEVVRVPEPGEEQEARVLDAAEGQDEVAGPDGERAAGPRRHPKGGDRLARALHVDRRPADEGADRAAPRDAGRMLAQEDVARAVAERDVRHVPVLWWRRVVERPRAAEFPRARVERVEVRAAERPARPRDALARLEVDRRERRVARAELPGRELRRPERRRAAEAGRARRRERRVAPFDLAALGLPALDERHTDARLLELERRREAGDAAARHADIGLDDLPIRNRACLYQHLAAPAVSPSVSFIAQNATRRQRSRP